VLILITVGIFIRIYAWALTLVFAIVEPAMYQAAVFGSKYSINAKWHWQYRVFLIDCFEVDFEYSFYYQA
jgi:hypothetical protein